MEERIWERVRGKRGEEMKKQKFSKEVGKKGRKKQKEKKHKNRFGQAKTLEVSSRGKREVGSTDSWISLNKFYSD